MPRLCSQRRSCQRQGCYIASSRRTVPHAPWSCCRTQAQGPPCFLSYPWSCLTSSPNPASGPAFSPPASHITPPGYSRASAVASATPHAAADAAATFAATAMKPPDSVLLPTAPAATTTAAAPGAAALPYSVHLRHVRPSWRTLGPGRPLRPPPPPALPHGGRAGSGAASAEQYGMEEDEREEEGCIGRSHGGGNYSYSCCCRGNGADVRASAGVGAAPALARVSEGGVADGTTSEARGGDGRGGGGGGGVVLQLSQSKRGRKLLLAAAAAVAALATPFGPAVAELTHGGAAESAAAATVVAAATVSSGTTTAALDSVGVGAIGDVDASAAAALVAAGVTAVAPAAGYVPSPMEPGWEVWLGFVAGVVPFLIGSYEFGKRIIIQLRCEQCGGRGLVASSGPGRDRYLRKCPQCGGFFPWISWKLFLTSTAAPGNGGPLQQPRGQRSVLYSIPEKPDPVKQAEALARSQAAVEALQAAARPREMKDGHEAELGGQQQQQ